MIGLFLLNFSFAKEEKSLERENIYLKKISYFFRLLKERIRLFTTFGAKNKAKLLLAFAEKRINEYKIAKREGREEFAQFLLKRYERDLREVVKNTKLAQENNENIDDLVNEAAKITQESLKVLTSVYNKNIPQEKKKKISQVISKTKKFYELMEEILAGKKRKIIQKQTKKVGDFFTEKLKSILKKLWPIME